MQSATSGGDTVGGHDAPIGETEITLAKIWVELLKLDRVAVRQCFRLGGDSTAIAPHL
jgi:hypothetical protein